MNDEPGTYKDDPEWLEWREYLRRQRAKNPRYSLRNALLIGEEALEEIPEAPAETEDKPVSSAKAPIRKKGWRDYLLKGKQRSGRMIDGSSDIRIVFIPPDIPLTPGEADDSHE